MEKAQRMSIQDGEIIKLFFERSEQAIRELETKYGNACLKLSYNILGNRQDAEECVNDAYLGVWNAIPPAKPDPLLSFVLKIVRNLSLKKYWKNRAIKRDSAYTVSIHEIELFLATPNTTESEIDARELAKMIEEFLGMQTTENRVIFLRRYWFSDSYKNIANQMGLSEKAVSVRLTRIRRNLREFLIQKEVLV
ncbi:MAG: sigma-70 family RNA polymerase sigma factor [Saccharofermentanales bacterium]|jgi:RNA polymerase sigma factor (sigma-70 family)